MLTKASHRKKILIIPFCLLVLLAAVDWILTVSVYNRYFGARVETYEPTKQRVEFFDGLERTRYTFPSDRGQLLTGYLYTAGADPRGIIIIAGGYGAGHSNYIQCADYFAKHGYAVFAFDNTGCDESGGDSMIGMPQGVIDLEYAISFVEQSGNLPSLPIGLFGHSWGGYSVCAVLASHPEIKAVISCAGYNRSESMFIAEGRTIAGPAVYLTLPFLKLHELIQFGKYASLTAEDGFAASDARVMIVQSADDDTVLPEFGYDIYYRNHRDDPRFSFLCLEGRGHRFFNISTPYYEEANASLEQWRDSLDYDYNDPANAGRFAADQAEYIHQNVNIKALWQNRLDTDLFDRFLAFYDQSLS